MTHKYDGVVCSVDGCGKEVGMAGMCTSHYQSTWRKARREYIKTNNITCKVEGCDNLKHIQGNGYCTLHFKRLRRNGSLDRVLGVARKCEADGCDDLGTGKDIALCVKHRHNLDRYGSPNLTFKKVNSNPCEVPGCCGVTYKRYRKPYGDNVSGSYCNRHRSILWKYDLGGKHFVDYFGSSPYTCALCGDALDPNLPDGMHIDHDVPKSRGGSDTKENLQLLCKVCNMSKTALTTNEFVALCEKILNYRRK